MKTNKWFNVYFPNKGCIFFLFCFLSEKTICSINNEIPTTSVIPNVTDFLSTNDTENNTTDISNTTVTPVITTTTKPRTTSPDYSYLKMCPSNAPCSNLGASCISCKMNYYCIYGKAGITECEVKPNITCTGDRVFNRSYNCRYAYQLAMDKYICNTHMATTCGMKKAPLESYYALCTVKEEYLCLGNRTFYKKFDCNWTAGYKWSTAFVLSVTLGGFGVDRFYLGMWREGIGKLFSFAGLGVWTIVDVILIGVGYVGPHDSSLDIYPWD